jgi:hypothetical protein
MGPPNRYDFQDNLNKGQVGERAVIAILSKTLEVRDLTDYENYKAYQQKGLDIEFLNRKTGAWDRADVKTNVAESGLHFIELYKREGELGWFHTTKSDWIFCFSIYTKCVYFYSINEMRNYISGRFEKGNINTSHLKSGAIGVWLPVETNIMIKKFQ